ncbi:MAG: M48 family metalloprotease, partial [Elusimicrobia bacterium]|nr:M48 family metalloprotease [Elusimicrobiota bacterium]
MRAPAAAPESRLSRFWRAPLRALGLAPARSAPTDEQAADKELLELRSQVESEKFAILRNDVGGAVGRSDIHRQVNNVLRRIMDANGLDPESVTLAIGGSFIPNAFTTITPAEIAFLKKKGRLSATFKNSNVFISRGLLEAYEGAPDATLAFVLAHEVAHNRLGHMKSLFGSFQMLGHLLEFEADTEALKMIARAGYDPRQALESLELIQRRMDALKTAYPLLNGQHSEFHRLLNRWRDIHPHPSMRRANLQNHLSEALELHAQSSFKTRPADRLAKIAAKLAASPLRNGLTRFEEKAAAIVSSTETSYYEKVVALEKLLPQRLYRIAKSSRSVGEDPFEYRLRLEDQLVVENAFRAMAARAQTLADLSNLHQMYERLRSAYSASNFPSRKAYRCMVARQVKLVWAQAGRDAAPARLREFIGDVSAIALQRLFNAGLNRAKTLEQFDAALEFLGNNAFPLGFAPGKIDPDAAAKLARLLLRKGMDLAGDPSAAPDERLAQAVEHAQSRIPTILLTSAPGNSPPPNYISTHLKAEVIDFYFTGEAGATPRWKLLDMILLLEGKSRAQIHSHKDKAELHRDIKSTGVMNRWNARYFRPLGVDAENPDKPEPLFERLKPVSLRLPDAGELLQILSILPYGARRLTRNGDFIFLQVPEAVAATILAQSPAAQEEFWRQATAWTIRDYVARRQFVDSKDLLEKQVGELSKIQYSVVCSASGLGPMVAALRGMHRALAEAEIAGGVDEAKALSRIADHMIKSVINENAAKQLKTVRNSETGVDPAEFKALTEIIYSLDSRFSSFNTTDRLRALSTAFYHAAAHGRPLAGLIAYTRYLWKNSEDGTRGSHTVNAEYFTERNKKTFREAGVSEDFFRLPFDMSSTLTSGALGLIADPKAGVPQLLGASLALYFKHQYASHGGHLEEAAQQTLAFLLIEEAARRVRAPDQAQAAAR